MATFRDLWVSCSSNVRPLTTAAPIVSKYSVIPASSLFLESVWYRRPGQRLGVAKATARSLHRERRS